MPPTFALRVLAPGAALALALAGAPAAGAEEPTEAPTPTIYKWVDTNGIAHYTTQLERIPLGLRRDARRLGRKRDAPPVTAAPPPLATYGAASAGGPSEAERWAASDRPRTYTDDGWGAAEFDEGEADGGSPGGAEPAGPATPSRAEIEAQRREIDARIASVEADIAADEEILKRFVSAPPPQDPSEVAYDTSFREVAERLPALLAELESLQDERDGLGEFDGPGELDGD